MADDKKKILLISDHPLVPSGVGTQAKYVIEGLLATGKYRFICFGGAIQHQDPRPQKVEPEKYGDDWIILPVIGYGDKNVMRSVLLSERPAAIVFITDPRFYGWLWEMEDEVRKVCPLVYWHVWDNDPIPKFNKIFYDSTDHIASISLKTHGIVESLGHGSCEYLPHGLPTDVFKPVAEEVIAKFKADHYGPHADKFVVFWNNRNARRKATGDVIASFSKFADKVGRDKVSLMMHTGVKDPEGQDVLAVAEEFGVTKELIVSEKRVTPEDMNMYYNSADVTLNIATNEGFGLGTLESMFAGTPIIAHFTGGLQFQLGDWWHDENGKICVDYKDQASMTAKAKKLWGANKGNWWGVPVFPASRSCTGSQQIPYIYDDRVAHEDVVKALIRIYEMGRKGRRELGARAHDWAVKYFNLELMMKRWDSTLEGVIARHAESPVDSLRIASI